MREKILSIIYDEMNALMEQDSVQGEMNEETGIYGSSGRLDSMGLVSLLVAVEQAVEDEFDIEIAIANARAMSQKNSPFKTVGSLADYVTELVKDAK